MSDGQVAFEKAMSARARYLKQPHSSYITLAELDRGEAMLEISDWWHFWVGWCVAHDLDPMTGDPLPLTDEERWETHKLHSAWCDRNGAPDSEYYAVYASDWEKISECLVDPDNRELLNRLKRLADVEEAERVVTFARPCAACGEAMNSHMLGRCARCRTEPLHYECQCPTCAVV